MRRIPPLDQPGNFLRPGREIREKAEHAPRTGRDAVTGETRIAPQDRDDLLLRRAAKGDEEAFALLYRRHQGALYRFALRMTGSAWGAEEIVQDVFMTLIRAPKKYDPERGSVGALLFGIARNRVMKHLERSPREVPLEEKNEDGTGAGIILQDSFTPAMWVEKRERMHHVRAAVLGFAGRVSRSCRDVRTGRNELRRSGADDRLPDRNDSFAAAPRSRPAAGETGDVAGCASAHESGEVKELWNRLGKMQ